MIHSGRKASKTPQKHHTHTHVSNITAMLGAVVFVTFLCLSVNDSTESQNVSATFGEGAYQVFAYTDPVTDSENDTFAPTDDSIWAYLESVIAKLIYGEQ